MGTSFRGPKELAEKQAALQAKLAEKQKAEGAVGQTTNAASAASLSKPAEKSATAPVKAEATELHASILYDFDRLRTKPWPEEVVPEQLERHLKDEDFARYLKMSRQEFAKLPKWKQLNIKKGVGLF